MLKPRTAIHNLDMSKIIFVASVHHTIKSTRNNISVHEIITRDFQSDQLSGDIVSQKR